MTTEADWYDRGYRAHEHRALLPLEDSPWLSLYIAAARRVPDKANVVDLGCGTGRFARLVKNRGYIGLDFSWVAIKEARLYNPGMDFRQADLRTTEFPPADVYVCLEVLEHLEDDLALLERIPSGAKLVLSVPSYDSESHVRWFPSAGDVWARYGGFFEHRAAERDTVRVGKDRWIYLLSGPKH